MTTRAFLVGLNLSQHTGLDIEASLDELAELAFTRGFPVEGRLIQSRTKPHPGTYIGEGKTEELKLLVEEKKVELVITDDELTPAQHKNLEKTLEIKVIDRTGLILEIFAQRAHTKEAQLQVELAQLEYLMPRLTKLWTHLSRQTGGIGTKGPGEKQLEVDKRQIRKRITVIKEKIKKMSSQRDVRSRKREDVPAIVGAIMGYTNAGKSTLLNWLTGAEVLAENKLFATLDPTTRRFMLPDKSEVLLSDTVGFIQKLPHLLVTSFRSTLEEVKRADFLIHLVDISHPNYKILIDTANQLLEELDVLGKPIIYVFNKTDKFDAPELLESAAGPYEPHIFISALKKKGLDDFISGIQSLLSRYNDEKTYRIPFSRMDIVSQLHKYGTVIDEIYTNDVEITVRINRIIGEKIMGRLGASIDS